MENKNSDIFEITSSNKPVNNQDNNFFLNEKVVISPEISEPIRRLNDYDFNLLKEDAYKDVSDDLFKLEYKISKIEDEIKNIDLELQAAEDIQNNELIGELNYRKRILLEDLEALTVIYNDKSLSAKISGSISGMFGDKLKNINNMKTKLADVSERVIAKLPKRLSSLFELKKSLNKLENINRSVNELMSLNIPYGENIDKYDRLSKYIIKANSIQNEISRFIK